MTVSIRRLPADVANRIAAGEVIERPASIVKELVDNAIDADAARVDVEIESGGVALIRVRDDGCGLVREELPVAFERHATSKLSTADDLWSISTLGFRGEALPSIAAAAREVELTSRPPGELAGSRIVLRDGSVASHGDHGSAAGTAIVVRDVFANQPARRAFLRTTSSEARAVLDVVVNAALSRPDLAFTLTADGRAVFRSGGGHLRDAAAAVFGRSVAAGLLEASGESGEVTVSGLVGEPGQHRATRTAIVLIVNARPIASRSLGFAVEEAYQGLLPRGRHPVAVLHVQLPPAALDVNVHPTKAQVRFRDERPVFGALQRAVRGALLAAAPAATLHLPSAPSADSLAHAPPLFESWRQRREIEDAPPSPVEGPAPRSFPMLRAVGQIRETYVIAEGPDGMYLIDQHAAHERVMFDRFRAQREQRRPEVQALLSPLTIDLSPGQTLMLEREGEALAALGFEIEPFGDGGIIVRAVPAPFAGRREARVDLAGAVGALLDALGDGRPAESDDRATATLACHASVRAGMALSAEEQRALIRDLEAATRPRTCPHGRPTMMHLSADALDRGFGRR